jgi:predicted ATP-dependent protease
MSEKEDIVMELNKKAEDFERQYGELMCLRANIAAINQMLIYRNRGNELLEVFTEIIDGVKKNEDCTTSSV